MLGLFACLRANHNIYASLQFRLSVWFPSLLLWITHNSAINIDVYVCLNVYVSTLNLCVMIWFLYQYRRKISIVYVMLLEWIAVLFSWYTKISLFSTGRKEQREKNPVVQYSNRSLLLQSEEYFCLFVA